MYSIKLYLQQISRYEQLLFKFTIIVSRQNHIGAYVFSENKFVVAERFCGYPENFFVVEILENPTSKMFEVFPKYFEAE